MSVYKPLLNSAYQVEGYSIKGRKLLNEDSFLCIEHKSSFLVLVADGVGGHRNGDYASNATIELFYERFLAVEDEHFAPDIFLNFTAYEAATMVMQKSADNQDFMYCGTTLSGFLWMNKQFYTINVGDSRTYEFTPQKELRRLTHDHSVVQELLDAGLITENEAFVHPNRNIITSAIGMPLDRIKITVEGPYPYFEGSTLLVCSDGLHDALDDVVLQSILTRKAHQGLSEKLTEMAFDAGGSDNITACLFYPTAK